MKKIAADRNYRLVKEAVKYVSNNPAKKPSFDLSVLHADVEKIKKNHAAQIQRAEQHIIKNNSNIKKLWEKIFPEVPMP